MPSLVVEFSEDLRHTYKVIRNKPEEEDWPPYQPTSIVNVTVIHYKNKQARQELIEVPKHLIMGASGIGKLKSSPPSHCKVSKDISEIFKVDPTNQTKGNTEGKPPKLILIEGAPGIGKTVLAKEIAYLWANHKLLTDCILVILIHLRDPRVHTMQSVEELLQIYTTKEEMIKEVNNYLIKASGQNVAFVFDGLDEFPSLQKDLIIKDIIGDKYHRKFHKSIVVVTSRPTATLYLHRIVDRRIEILGFASQERDNLISSKFPDKRVELEKYFKEHPLISSLCYIPLNLAIVLYLFHQGNLPETLTEMNELFVIHTVYRHFERIKSPLPGCTKCLNEMPENIIQILRKLSKLAFEGLQKDQLVFTFKDLKDFCPEVYEVPEAANGYSLLQAVKHYPHKRVGTTFSFNFLHLTMQEYLAAYYVSTLSEKQQQELLQYTFWNDHFNFMWMMYVGIVGAESGAFASFVRMIKKEEIRMLGIHDKVKYLHLFQCYMEAKINTNITPVISLIFSGGSIDLSGITLLSYHITSLLSFMSTSSVRKWKRLELKNCNLHQSEMYNLVRHTISNNQKMSTLNYVDLSSNNSSPWGVYCAIISYSSVTSLSLGGDKGMKDYIKEITVSLQGNTSLQSLTLFNIGKIGVESVQVLMNTLKNLHLSLAWKEFNKEHNILFDTNRVVNVSILYDDSDDDYDDDYDNYDHDDDEYVYYDDEYDDDDDDDLSESLSSSSDIICSKKYQTKPVIDLSGKWIDDDAAHVLAFGLSNNTTVEELNISHNEISDEGAVAIFDCLKHNKTLKKLDLSYNRINGNVMNKMIENIENQGTRLTIEYVDLSKNSSSPWGVYCAVIRHSCVNSLTLCGDLRMKEYIEEITDSLQANTTLELLSLFGIGRNGVESIKAVLMNTFTLKRLNLSWEKFSKGIENKILMHAIFLSSNDDTMQLTTAISSVNINILYDDHENIFTSTRSSQNHRSNTIIKLSGKNIYDDAAHVLAFGLCNNTTVEELNILGTSIDEGALAILNCLKHNKTLKRLDLSQNEIKVNKLSKTIKDLGTTLSLEYVDLSNNGLHPCYSRGLSPWGVYCAIIRHCSINSLTLCGDEGMEEYIKEITDSLQANTTLQSLSLYGIGKIGVESIKEILMNNFTVKRLNLSWKKINSNKHVVLLHTTFSLSTEDPIQIQTVVNSCNRDVNVNILYDDDGVDSQSLSSDSTNVINLSDKKIKDDAVHVLVLGLCNNRTVEQLIISHNDIIYGGAAIFECVINHNKTLKKLDLSNNRITNNGMNKVTEMIRSSNITLLLEYVDLSENGSSPWGVYCAIIRQSCVNSLTLCGDEGMEEYIKEITDSLQANITLQSLSLYSIGKIGVESIKKILINNFTVKRLNLSWKKINNSKHIVLLPSTDNLIQIQTIVNSCNRDVNVNILYDDDGVDSQSLSSNSTNVINLSDKKINDDAVHVLVLGLCNNTVEQLIISHNDIIYGGASIFECVLNHNKTLKKLDLSNNRITNNGMNKVIEMIRSSNITLLLEYVDLSENGSSPWGVYCAIIRQSCVNSLTLCGDEGMEEYIKEITDSLQANTALQSLSLYSIGKIGVESIKKILINNFTVKRLDLSWKKINNNKHMVLLHTTFSVSTDNLIQTIVNSYNRDVNVNVLYDDDGVDYSQSLSLSTSFDFLRKSDLTNVINLSGKQINDDAVHVLVLGLFNNRTVEQLIISHNDIIYGGAAIFECIINHNKTLKKLDLSNNRITNNGMNKVTEMIRSSSFTLLEYVDFSENGSSPWGVYCAIIRRCCVNSLTLCGDEGINEYIKEMLYSLQVNTTLQSLTLHGFHLENAITFFSSQTKIASVINIDTIVVKSNVCPSFATINLSNITINFSNIIVNDADLVHFMKCNYARKLIISDNAITDNGITVICEFLKCNETLKKLDLSHNGISVKGMNELLRNINQGTALSLEYVDLSKNIPSPWGVYCAIIRHSCVNSLILCGDKGMEEYIKEITDSLQANTKLQSLSLYSIGKNGVESIKAVLLNNLTLRSLNLSWIKIHSENVLMHTLFSTNTTHTLKATGADVNRVVDVNIIFCHSHYCTQNYTSKAVINLSYKNIDDDAAHVLAFGLCNNTTVEELNISNNQITDEGATAIINCLKQNKTLKKLDLSWNNIDVRKLKVLQSNYSYIDLSNNNIGNSSS